MKKKAEEISIESLNLSTKNYVALKRNGIVTLEDLLKYRIYYKKAKKSLYTIHNVGEKSTVEIIEKIHSMGYRFADEIEVIQNLGLSSKTYHAVIQKKKLANKNQVIF